MIGGHSYLHKLDGKGTKFKFKGFLENYSEKQKVLNSPDGKGNPLFVLRKSPSDVLRVSRCKCEQSG
jgi:hypothetical protein